MSHSRKFHSDPHSNLQGYLTVLLHSFGKVLEMKFVPRRLCCAAPVPVLVNCVKSILVSHHILCGRESL